MSSLRRCWLIAFFLSGPVLLGAQTERAADTSQVSSSLDVVAPAEGEGAGIGQAEPSTYLEPEKYAVEGLIGLNGFGFYAAKPFSRHLVVRLGGNFISYSGSFFEQGANVDGSLRFAYGKAEVDYFPNGGNGRFHISPLLVFANNTRVHANVLIDPTTTLDFNGDTYSSDPTDPLRGTGQVDFAKTAPGLAIGYGNVTHGRGHWSYPVELGFFYVGQPKLAVDFRGTACDVSHPANGCGDITQDPDFQKDLAAFIVRQHHNLSYAKFIPMLNLGIGYRF